MPQPTLSVGLDVPSQSISIAVAEAGREPVRFLKKLPPMGTGLLRFGSRCRLGPQVAQWFFSH